MKDASIGVVQVEVSERRQFQTMTGPPTNCALQRYSAVETKNLRLSLLEHGNAGWPNSCLCPVCRLSIRSSMGLLAPSPPRSDYYVHSGCIRLPFCIFISADLQTFYWTAGNHVQEVAVPCILTQSPIKPGEIG